MRKSGDVVSLHRVQEDELDGLSDERRLFVYHWLIIIAFGVKLLS